MKTILTLLLAALALVTLAQPQKINYQAIALGSNGKPLKNTAVSLRLSILDSAATGTVLYTETQPATTDAGGQFSVYLGTGTPTAGTFASLPWANGNDKFLKVEMDAQGGTNYQTMGTTQLVSVPYAMASGTANVIEEGTLKKMKNGHIFRLEYDGTPGGYWKLISGFTPAIITQDTFFVCDTSIWIKGKNKRKLFEDPAWSFFGSNGVNGYSQSADSIEIFRRYGDTVFVVYNVFAPGINGNGINADSAYVIFLNLTTSTAGPDQLSLTGTTATLAANTPAAGETGIWTITTGSGATLNNANSPTATFTKGTDSAYTLVWTITGPCGTSRDTVNISFQNVVMNVPCPGVASITYAGESYPTVQIGTQCWLAKNLNVGSMINFSDDQTNNQVIEKFCLINDTTSCATYGGLYQWAEAVQYQNGASNANSPSPAFTGSVRGICPTGWHLPSDAEWSSLETTLGGSSVAGVALKSTSGLWHYPNTIATNSSGFSALPGGDRRDKGNGPYNEGLVTFFWSSSESSTADATARALVFDDSSIYRDVGYEKDRGFSVRCLNDSCFTTTTSAGPDQLSLTGTTATLAANTPAAGETGTWTITTGSGATLNNANSPTATFTKGTDSAYTLVWTITGPCGSSRDTVNLLFPAPVGTACGQTVSYAGESYPTVQIGTQCWFAKNLNVGTMIQGANDQTNNSTLEKYCYNNDPANCTTYGGLYQWAEAVQYQN